MFLYAHTGNFNYDEFSSYIIMLLGKAKCIKSFIVQSTLYIYSTVNQLIMHHQAMKWAENVAWILKQIGMVQLLWLRYAP